MVAACATSSTLAPIEINELSNLICPLCFAGVLAREPNKQLSLKTIKRMLDTCSRAKSRTCISGGKPALGLGLSSSSMPFGHAQGLYARARSSTALGVGAVAIMTTA
jgi:hypothetical protein